MAEKANAETGPVLFAYDGSDLAQAAIMEAERQLSRGRRAIVLTVWRPFSVGFVVPPELELNANAPNEVRAAAERTAGQGASLAQTAGFEAKSMTKEASPIWKGIVDVADHHDSSLLVLGSHGRSGFPEALLGSVAQAVAAHSRQPVLIVHRRD